MFLKKKAQGIFKKAAQNLFKLFYGKIKHVNDDNFISKLEKKKINNLIPTAKYKKNYFTYLIKNGRVYTDYVENVAYISDNFLINDASYQQINGELKESSFNVVLKKGTPRLIKKIKGRVLSLIQGASGSNYSHWLLEILPKIKMYSENYDINDLSHIYTPKLETFHKETLSVLNLKKIGFISSEIHRHIEADELVTVDHPYYFSGTILEQNQFLPEWVLDWIRNTYIKFAKECEISDKIFIDRKDSKNLHNQIINNDEVLNYFSKKGFKTYRLEKLNFFEKIYLFNNAKIIAGVHGAGFSNLVFSKPSTQIIEIKTKNNPNKIYEKISNFANLNYKLLEVPLMDNQDKTQGDIFLDNSALERMSKYL